MKSSHYVIQSHAPDGSMIEDRFSGTETEVRAFALNLPAKIVDTYELKRIQLACKGLSPDNEVDYLNTQIDSGKVKSISDI